GSSLDYMRLKLEELTRTIRQHHEVAYTYATVGDAAGSGAVDVADIYVRLLPKADRHLSQNAISNVIRTDVNRVAGVTCYVFSNGFGDNRKQVLVQVRGSDLATITRFANQLLPVV